ncbi:MAG: HxsD-like protein [Myxococcales bacterium]|nr:HxsD-like protein [Myxococcales bacterium]
MIELRFHRDVYAGEAVDAAANLFARFGRLERIEEPTHWVVRVTARDPARERQLAGELGNHALGLSAERRGQP